MKRVVSNPFKKKKEVPTEIQQQLRIEAGLSEIKGTEHLRKRLQHSDEEIDIMIKEINGRLSKLVLKKDLTDTQKTELNAMKNELVNWHMAKMVVQASTPWLRSGDSKEMSQRYADFCLFFGRNFNKPNMQELIMAASLYLHGISHIDKDVTPAPTIWVQTPVMPGYKPQVPVGTETDNVRTD